MVLRNPLSRGSTCLVVLLFVVFVCGCNQRPARKKLPDGIAGNVFSWEGVTTSWDRQLEKLPGLPPFYATDTMLRVGGRATDLLDVALPDQEFDSLAERLVTAYSPMARTLLDELKARGEKGVLIDLRANAEASCADGYSASYQVGLQGQVDDGLSLPVVFCWDAPSTARATAFMDALRGMPGFIYTRIVAGRNGSSGEAGCFSANPPTNFDQQ